MPPREKNSLPQTDWEQTQPFSLSGAPAKLVSTAVKCGTSTWEENTLKNIAESTHVSAISVSDMPPPPPPRPSRPSCPSLSPAAISLTHASYAASATALKPPKDLLPTTTSAGSCSSSRQMSLVGVRCSRRRKSQSRAAVKVSIVGWLLSMLSAGVSTSRDKNFT